MGTNERGEATKDVHFGLGQHEIEAHYIRVGELATHGFSPERDDI